MTDGLLQKLEEKLLALVQELDGLRKELNLRKQENSILKTEKFNYTKRLQELISLLEAQDKSGGSFADNVESLHGAENEAVAG